VVAVAAAAGVSFALIEGSLARAQESNSSGAINLGGRGWSAYESLPGVSEQSTNQLEFALRGGFATDYMYRGTTLSDHSLSSTQALRWRASSCQPNPLPKLP